MKTKLTLLLLCGMFFTNLKMNAQSYNSAVGLRFGYPTSVSYKKFLNDSKAIEAYAGLRSWSGYSYVSLNAALQFHKPIESVQNLSWYWGAGAGAYIWSFDSGFPGADDGSFGLALQGYLGLDYKISSAPVNLSLDWVPSFFLTGYGNGFGGGYGGLSARYVLGDKK
jgi:hypothetical protein